MSSGPDITFKLLAETENNVADELLLVAVDSGNRALAEQALSALVMRQSPWGQQQVLRRWKGFAPNLKSLMSEHASWMSQTLRHVILHRDAELWPVACQAMIEMHEFDQIPQLVEVTCTPGDPLASEAANTAIELAELLHEELFRPRDYRNRRDPQIQRAFVLPSLERAASTASEHGQATIVEAFLLLAGHDNMTLRRVLQSPADRSFASVASALQFSTRTGIQRLLLSMLDDTTTPLGALTILARRHDLSFVRLLLRKVGNEPSPAVKANLRRIENIPWMQENLSILEALSEAEQAGAVQMAVLSHLPRSQSLAVLAAILRQGKLAARRIAATALEEFSTSAASELALRVLDDEDPTVRAAVVKSLRKRISPAVLSRLVKMLDSPHQVERSAVQEALEDFHFPRFLANFESLVPSIRQSTGAIVRKVDADTIPLLKIELLADSKIRQRRALDMMLALDVASSMIDSLTLLLSDEDQFLRLETLRVLATIDTPESRLAVRQSLTDSHPLVRDAAERILADFASGVRRSSSSMSDTQQTSSAGLSGKGDTVPLSSIALSLPPTASHTGGNNPSVVPGGVRETSQ
ncbi:hypothetical protein Psta_3788 [Pirellula staleyi DSM 6068]|uniref:PBS lyase HEAT domain protein repeat-containing protein n=1 Tax=Pirellula staleyi (strain ATCC 27377 / DSM 6068 / ICPB 4128) TaxID=530564 RepID=D2R078_PIRSD|nr:HEAT repeat domain-containing protein [Pirellula staleyi]ADB18443.1 hypothetical protein Psta_3788 [Pirellula staleyi DSM 6068]